MRNKKRSGYEYVAVRPLMPRMILGSLTRENAFWHVNTRHFLDEKHAYQNAEENTSGMHGNFRVPGIGGRFHNTDELCMWIIQILDVFGYEQLINVLEERATSRYGKSLDEMLAGDGIDIELPCARAGLVYFNDHRSPEVANNVRLVFKWGGEYTLRDRLKLVTAYPVL